MDSDKADKPIAFEVATVIISSVIIVILTWFVARYAFDWLEAPGLN